MAANKATAGITAHRAHSPHGLVTARSIIFGVVRLFSTSWSTVAAAPLGALDHQYDDQSEDDDGNVWVLLAASMVLVLLGGAFAGLTIALMGQDGIYLQVISRDRSEPQSRNAKRVYKLLRKGKHWVLVTLLLANVIVNETLPVVLDRCLGGGVAAVVGSTVLIVIFGEVIPQSLCVRYGLQIGAAMAKFVLFLMYFLAPIAWPTAKLLDYLLGEDHGTVYKKSGLKTLVTLHKTLGDQSQRLNQDEVTIISAVLDLKEKPVEQVMTPMDDVFTMSEDTVLDENTMAMILSAGYSRIPIHETGNPNNFVGMLLVKILITYDPEDAKHVKYFPLATLPETRPETSCLDIMNFFQEGKSHMVLVSEFPGEDRGALGVVTLEDVIEELIGEEIIDESDVYIDVHKAIRRLAPAPKARIHQRSSEGLNTRAGDELTVWADHDDAHLDHAPARLIKTDSQTGRNDLLQIMATSPKTATFMMRRSSAGLGGETVKTSYSVRANIEEMREHLKHLGPSNPATNPKSTRSTTVKIKQSTQRAPSATDDAVVDSQHDDDNETTSLLRSTMTSKDGVQALRTEGYGAVSPERQRPASSERAMSGATRTPCQVDDETEALDLDTDNNSDMTSLRNYRGGSFMPKRSTVRSGSITENIFESRGVRKVVLEMSSNDGDHNATVFVVPDATKAQTRDSQGFFSTDSAAEVDHSGTSAAGDFGQSHPGGPSGEGLSLGTGDAVDETEEMAEEGGEPTPKKKQRKKKRDKGKRW